MKPIALQLYTLREAAAKDFVGVLKQVAEVGYKGVELAGTHGMSADELGDILDDLGLEVCSSHGPMPTEENADEQIELADILGYDYLITGFGPDQFSTIAGAKEAAAKFEEGSAVLSESGLILGCHNHWWEFTTTEGQLPYQVLMDEAPSIVGQIDVYWAQTGGQNAAEMVARFKDRVPLLHLKDGPAKQGVPMTAVGSGTLDMPAIVKAADPEVLEWLIVELDDCATDMFGAVVDSYKYLTSNKLAVGNK